MFFFLFTNAGGGSSKIEKRSWHRRQFVYIFKQSRLRQVSEIYIALFSSVIKLYTMLSRPEARVHSALEVALVADSGLCTDVEHTVKARMAAGCSLLCCLSVDGRLMLSDVSEAGTPVHVLEDSYTE